MTATKPTPARANRERADDADRMLARLCERLWSAWLLADEETVTRIWKGVQRIERREQEADHADGA